MNELTMGQRIAARRKLLNLSQEALAERLDISRQAISKWESDAAIPEIDKLIALSKLYNVSVGWLLGVEAEEAPVSDELSEAQLKMVEEIVRQYHAKPSGNRLFWSFAMVLVGVIGIVTLCIASFIYSPSTQDYSNQISNLEANFSSIQTQIHNMDTLLHEQIETDKLLRSHVPLVYLNEYRETVDLTFYFFPKLYQENVSAYLSILNPEAGVSQMPECRWTGDRYLVHATLPLADNYQYSFLLVSSSGYEEELLDRNTYYTDLLAHSAFYIMEDHPKYMQMKAGQSAPIPMDETVYRYDVPLNMPCIQEKDGFVPFDDVKISLLHNDEPIWEADYSDAFLELYKKENITVPLNPDIQVELPALCEGDRLILTLTATTHTGRTMVTQLDDLTVTAP